MKTSEENNMDYGRHNAESLTAFLTLVGSFLTTASLYTNFLSKSALKPHLLEASIVVLLILAGLAIMSVLFGYTRRRDHVVTCYKEREEGRSYYAELYNDGTGKCLHNYLPDYYNAFFVFFLIVFLLFSYALLMKQTCPVIIIGVISCLIAILSVYYIKFKDYLELSDKAGKKSL